MYYNCSCIYYISNYNFLEVLMMNKDPFIWCQIKLLTVQ